MTKDKALDLALEALEAALSDDQPYIDKSKAAITAIKQALAAPVQEPVAYWIPKAEQFCIADPSGRPFAKAWEPLYTTPPAAQRQWVGLTDEELSKFDVDPIEAKLMIAKLRSKNDDRN